MTPLVLVAIAPTFAYNTEILERFSQRASTTPRSSSAPLLQRMPRAPPRAPEGIENMAVAVTVAAVLTATLVTVTATITASAASIGVASNAVATIATLALIGAAIGLLALVTWASVRKRARIDT